MTIEQAAAKLRAREISAVELAQESLRRIRQHQPLLNAFITVTEDLALDQARRADEELSRGIDRGPLHGIPYALKDLFKTRGIRTTAGSKIFADYVPDRDCEVYRKLTEAGAVLMGKTGLHELAFGITNDNPHFGAVRNPRDPARIPGGSSGGSGAAVAADLVFFAMGTDTGGSIRIPASYCGCVGLKPTFDLVSRAGVLPLSSSMDHVGPLTRTVRDAALVMKAIADVDSATGQSIVGRRIGVPRNFFTERLSPAVESAFGQALKRAETLGASLVPIAVPDPAAINTVARIIQLSEASSFLQPHLHRRGDFGTDLLSLLDQGRLISATDYVDAQRLRRLYQKRWSELWERVDVIFTPTTPIQAPLIGQTLVADEDVRLASTRLVRPFNAIGLPALSIPFGTTGLPPGLQVIGPGRSEQTLFSIAEPLTQS
ncbi:MAG: amidase [Bryobacteraceae bacterium]|jgi:aspartyl-tRNA(Asn)/glutamyl-tRNA(Gln) amidotransferase subunit A